MEEAVGIIIGLAILVGVYLLVFRKKPNEIEGETKEEKKKRAEAEKAFSNYQFRVANLTASNAEENRDFVVAIIGLPEFQSKTPQQIEDWIKSKVGKEGTLNSYNAELGLQELTYTTEDKVIDVFFLIVEETSQNVIDWEKPKEPKEPEPPIEPEPELPPVIVEPELPVEPEPETPFPIFRFPDLFEMKQTEDSKIFEINIPEGEEDKTNIIQEQLNDIPDGTFLAPTVIKFKAGKHLTEGSAENIGRLTEINAINYLRGKKYIIVEGGGVEFYTTAPYTPYGGNVTSGDFSRRRHFKVMDCEFITLRDIKISGSNTIPGLKLSTAPEFTPAFWKGGKDTGSRGNAPGYEMYWEFEHGFDIRNSKNIILEGIEVYGVWGDGVYVGDCHNTIIRNSKLDKIGRQAIATASLDSLLIDNVYCDNIRRTGVDLEPQGAGIYNVEIRNCYFNTVHKPLAAIGRGKVDNVNYHHNKYKTTSGSVTLGETRTKRYNWYFGYNERLDEAYGSSGGSFSFLNMENIIVEHNHDMITDKQGKVSVDFENCSGQLIVRDNYFDRGIYIKALGTTDPDSVVSENNTPEQTVI